MNKATAFTPADRPFLAASVGQGQSQSQSPGQGQSQGPGQGQTQRAVLLGLPFDGTVCYRRGTWKGPDAIRELSESLETYSPRLDRELDEHGRALAADLGNIWPDGSDGSDAGDAGDGDGGVGKDARAALSSAGFSEETVARYLEKVEAAARSLFRAGAFPFTLGGEHLVTLPLVRAAAAQYPGLAVVDFDAHTDLRDEMEGRRLSHATVMRRVLEVIAPDDLHQFGIRSGTKAEFDLARQGIGSFHETVGDNPKNALNKLWGRPVYLTIDIDVLDPAYAPGTGSPEPGGCTPSELLEAVYLIAQEHRRGRLRVVGFDLVEVHPDLDPAGLTAIIAAKVVREALLSLV